MCSTGLIYNCQQLKDLRSLKVKGSCNLIIFIGTNREQTISFFFIDLHWNSFCPLQRSSLEGTNCLNMKTIDVILVYFQRIVNSLVIFPNQSSFTMDWQQEPCQSDQSCILQLVIHLYRVRLY